MPKTNATAPVASQGTNEHSCGLATREYVLATCVHSLLANCESCESHCHPRQLVSYESLYMRILPYTVYHSKKACAKPKLHVGHTNKTNQ